MNETLTILITYGIYFLTILFELIYWSILIWVILSWGILLGMMSPGNRLFIFFTQLVDPIIRPFRWARMGMLDLSPIVAILFFSFCTQLMAGFMASFLG